MRYALITGGLGFIGSHIARRLLRDKHVDRAVLFDHYGGFISPTRDDFVDYRRLRVAGIEDRIIIERAQAEHVSVVQRLIRKYRPDYIFHLAALPLAAPDNINTEEALKGAVLSTSFLLETCDMLQQETDYKLKRFVYTSSSMVYGDFQYTPADEEHPLNPRGIYGTMKLAGEVVCQGLAETYGIPHTIIRPSAVYGPTDMNRRVTQIFVENALSGRKLIVNGADEALDFTFVEDAAKGFVLAATHARGAGETFNITSGHAHRLVEFAEALKQLIPSVEYEIRERDSSHPKRGTLGIDKARQRLGYEPDHTLETGLAKYVEFVRKNGGYATREVR